MALTILKDFRVAACMAEISMVSKLTLGMKHPVEVTVIMQDCCKINLD